MYRFTTVDVLCYFSFFYIIKLIDEQNIRYLIILLINFSYQEFTF